jgi:hypothetical protein
MDAFWDIGKGVLAMQILAKKEQAFCAIAEYGSVTLVSR